jgi:hypothetical protein
MIAPIQTKSENVNKTESKNLLFAFVTPEPHLSDNKIEDLPEVGEESLEILLDWYEKHLFESFLHKNHLKKMSMLTGLNKSIIRQWASKVRKVSLNLD